MAGDWIPIRIDLADEPEVIAIGDALGIEYDTVVGKLVRLWGWANRVSADGNANSVTQKWIDARVGIVGFAKQMVEVGWLTITTNGIEIPNFQTWNSQSAKTRLLGTKRVQKLRSGGDENCNGSSVTKALPEKRREQYSSSEDEGELFSALAEITGSDPVVSGPNLGRACKNLRKSDPPYTAAEVKRLHSMLEQRRFTLPLTVGTVEKYIGWTRNTSQKVRGKTLDETTKKIERDMLRRRAERESHESTRTPAATKP